MRRSFGQGLGGSGGGGRGGGGVIRNVHRAVRTTMGAGGSHGSSAEPHAHATSTRSTTSNNRNQPVNTTLSLSSTSLPCSYLNNSYMASPPNCPFTMSGDDFDWEYVDHEFESLHGDDIMFGSVPSNEEISHAVTSLQDSFKIGSELDWIEPSMNLCNSTSTLQVPSSDKVYEAFHLLQTEPSVQRMVISLSSDKAVWNAVMNNDVVREIREAVTEGKSISEGSGDSVNDTNPVTQVLRWIFVNTKDKVIEVVEKITKIVNELVQHMNKGKTDTNGSIDSFQEKLKSSFFLSIMVLLIVVVSRSRKC
ncbi:hypothetical protein CTI12_AA216750 [Artemisia annua]|uniref:Uncharacterized protein n=1 Tax=Artemisia annua TaxID=35608 RepID=A0A2U1NXF4_ARTAN|nr:hypothetical protein CTI12_AA216750 [Artemisia annua]